MALVLVLDVCVVVVEGVGPSPPTHVFFGCLGIANTAVFEFLGWCDFEGKFVLVLRVIGPNRVLVHHITLLKECSFLSSVILVLITLVILPSSSNHNTRCGLLMWVMINKKSITRTYLVFSFSFSFSFCFSRSFSFSFSLSFS